MIEDKIQSQAFAWFHNNYCLKHHQPRMKMFAVQNEILSTVFKQLPKSVAMKLASKFKAMGLSKGVSDTIVMLPNKTIYVEFKTATGRQGKEQKEFQEVCEGLGQEYYLVRSVEEFKELIKRQLGL